MSVMVPQSSLEALCNYLNEYIHSRNISQRTICAMYNGNAQFAHCLHFAQFKMRLVHHLCTLQLLLKQAWRAPTYVYLLMFLTVKGLFSESKL